jgi:hypothetical protein
MFRKLLQAYSEQITYHINVPENMDRLQLVSFEAGQLFRWCISVVLQIQKSNGVNVGQTVHRVSQVKRRCGCESLADI